MIILNKKLLITTILLTIIYKISIDKDTNFIMPENKVIDNNLMYKLSKIKYLFKKSY